MEIKVMLMGFGNVGKGFCRLVSEKKDFLMESTGMTVRITGIATRTHGCIYDTEGIDLDVLMSGVEKDPGKQLWQVAGYENPSRYLPRDMVIKGDYDVLAECTVTSLDSYDQALSYMESALSRGKSVITSNKAPIAFCYDRLSDLAQMNGGKVFFEGTVMSGTPLFSTFLGGMSGSRVNSFEGVLNGTCNYILEKMQGGMSFDKALEEARQKGYAEADPSMDIKGYDTALKALIVSNVMMEGICSDFDEIDISGIDDLPPDIFGNAGRSSGKLKLLARGILEGEKKILSVRPEVLEEEHPLYNLPGAMNGIVLDTDTLGRVCMTGAGAGSRETGSALLHDLVSFSRSFLKVGI